MHYMITDLRRLVINELPNVYSRTAEPSTEYFNYFKMVVATGVAPALLSF